MLGLVAFLLAVLGGTTDAAAVVPDPTFGTGGIVTTPIGPTAGDEDAAYAMAIEPSSGKIVLAGTSEGGDEFAVARYNANGSLDTSFSTDGIVTTDISGPIAMTSGADEGRAVVIQPDGKIVVAGFADAIPSSDGLGADFALVRYNADGSLDTNADADPGTDFGGDGKVTTTVGAFDSAAYALARQADGKLVAAGQSSAGSHFDFALVRYNGDGTLDTNADADPGTHFDTDGEATTDFAGVSANDAANAVAIQSDGKIVAAGYSNTGASGVSDDFALARYNANGSLDTNTDADPTVDFGGDGKVTTPISTQTTFNQDRANALAIQTNGKLIAAGSSQVTPTEEFALARYNADGSLDTDADADPGTDFSGDGIVTTNVSPIGNTSVAYGVAIQADGKLVAAGRATNSDCCTFHRDFGLARYNPNGSLDPTFSDDGIATTAVAADPFVDLARAVAIQADGKIVAGGYADVGTSFDDFDFALVRYIDVPQTTITSGPTGTTGNTTPTFAFASDEPGSTFQCALDGAPLGACSGPGDTHTPSSPLADGPHLFTVRATDTDGNADPTPATRAFTVDTQGPVIPPPGSSTSDADPPDTTITKRPKDKTRKKSATFEFSSDEPGSSFECSLDGGPFQPCGSPDVVKVKKGKHHFEVRATDAAGNVDPTPATDSWTVKKKKKKR